MSIGVVVNEQDESLYVNSNLVSPVLAIIGTATKGPVGIPTLCTSQADFKGKFGPLNVNSYGLYAAQWYLSQVSKLYYVRVANEETAATAKVEIPGTTGTTPVTNLVTLETNEVGTFYAGHVVKISEVTSESFKLEIKTSETGSVIFTASGVSLKSDNPNYIGKALEGSILRLKTIQDITATITAGTYPVTGGNNGFTDITDEVSDALDLLKSSNYKIDLLSTPGISYAGVVNKALHDVCEFRGDTLYLVDPPIDLNYEEVISWVNGVGDYDDHTAFNSSYGACYWSWQYVYDQINDKEVLVPPSVLAAPAIARSESLSKPWFAPAGLTRGLIKNALRSEYVPSNVEVDLLYENNVNSIITHESSGLVVWGQKTLWRNPTALDRINVRRLVTYIKRIVLNTCQFLVFEPNDSTTWYQFEDLLNPVLRSLVSNRGLYDYKIVPLRYLVTSDDINNNRMPAQILIKPTKSAEYIPVTIVLTSTGVEFTDYIKNLNE